MTQGGAGKATSFLSLQFPVAAGYGGSSSVEGMTNKASGLGRGGCALAFNIVSPLAIAKTLPPGPCVAHKVSFLRLGPLERFHMTEPH